MQFSQIVLLFAASGSLSLSGVHGMADKRNIFRKRKRIAVCFGPDQTPDRRAFTEDISPTGLFIKTANVCNPNTVIKIELLPLDLPPISFDARVMWAKRVPQNLFHLVKKSGMGVRIIRFHDGRDTYLELCEAYSTAPVSEA